MYIPTIEVAKGHPKSIHTPLEAVSLLQFPKIRDVRGNLTFIEGMRHVPFPIKRVYYLYDVPSGETRGGHAHKLHRECLIAASGSFTVTVDDGVERRDILLNSPSIGLYSPSMIWRELADFSSGSICLVLASEEYDESDYYRSYDDFLENVGRVAAGAVPGRARHVLGSQGRD